MIRALILLEATIAIISLIGLAVTGDIRWFIPSGVAGAAAVLMEVTRRDGIGRRR